MQKYFILTALLFIISAFKAGNDRPVHWRFDAKKTAQNEYDLIFTAKIDKNWHIYSQFLESDEGPIKTSFSFKTDNAFTLKEKVKEISKAITEEDKSFNMKLTFFENEAIFVQHVIINAPLKTIKGTLNYMCCDNNHCLAPEDVEFNFNVTYETNKK